MTDPTIHLTNNAQTIKKKTPNHNPNFPYLGFKLAKRSDTPSTPNTRAQQLKGEWKNWKDGETEAQYEIHGTLAMKRNGMNDRNEYGLASALTWSRRRLRTGSTTVRT